MRRIDGTSVTMAMPEAVVRENIRASLGRGLPQIHELPDWRERMPIAIAGGGPSLVDTLDELRRFENIMIAGSAHDWLVLRQIRPRWTVVCDPDPIMANYLRHPHRDCTYLVASQCDRAVFNAFNASHLVAIWHCGSNGPDSDIFGDKPSIPIGGGCTIGTRAMFIAIAMGFHDLHLFGMDTCVRPDAHHAYEFSEASESLGELMPICLGAPGSREFPMAPYMLGQLFDFKNTLKLFGNRVRFTVHGDGALAELMRLGEEKALARAA